MKKKITIAIGAIIFSSNAFSTNFNIVITKEKSNYVEPEWFTYNEYTEWSDTGYPYDCVETFTFEGSSVFRTEVCNQDQLRSYDEYLKEKHSGQKELINSGVEESQTIIKSEKTEVGSASVVSDTGFFNIIEGDNDSNNEFSLKVKLSKALDFPVTYTYNTQDITTSSVLDKAENLVYDQFGNPFISVVDNVGGGRLIFDGGFPKYYNNQWTSVDPKTVDDLPDQFKFMYNVVNWISETHRSRGKVLFYGDKSMDTLNYNVKYTGAADFGVGIPNAIEMTGLTPVVKNFLDYGGEHCTDKKAEISLSEMNQYASIVMMSSDHSLCTTFSEETSNNFTTYVNNGGGVYIITDHSVFQTGGNQILRKFGSEFYGTIDRTQGHNAYKLSTIWSNLENTEYDKDHALWSNFESTDYIPAGFSEGNVRLFTPKTDIVATRGTLKFLAGETEKSVTIKINGDNLKEEDESFRFMIESGDNTGYLNPSENDKIITILNDD